MADEVIARIIREMPPDRVVKILGDVPVEVLQEALRAKLSKTAPDLSSE
jgi:Mg/Co/Ni transporter MgtE